LGVRPEAFEMVFTMMLAMVQLTARNLKALPREVAAGAPLEESLWGWTSIRRIVEVLDLPLEMMRRHVAQLIEAGMVVEGASVRLSTPAGVVKRLQEAGVTDEMTRITLQAVNHVLREGAFVVRAPCEPAGRRAAATGEAEAAADTPEASAVK
jgi:hypothetical protein